MIVTLRNYSRYALGSVEIVLGFYLLINSLRPLVEEFEAGPVWKNSIEYFLTGVGIGTSGFWLRVLAVIVGVLMVVFAVLPDTPKRLRLRARLSFLAFLLFTYVGILVFIFTSLQDFFWIAPLASGFFAAAAYIGNSAEVSGREKNRQEKTAGGLPA